MVTNRKIILKKTPLDIPIILFFLSQLISTIFSLDRHTSFFGYYGRFNGGLFSTLSYIILFYAFISNKINIEKTLKAIISSSLLVIFWAIPGHFGYDLTCLLFAGQFNNSCWDNTILAFRPELRAFSTLGQPNWLGAYLAVAFFVGIYFLIKNKDDIKYLILNTLYLFLNFSMILFTRSRSAIFAVFAGLVLFTGYYLLFIKTNFKKVLFILLIVTVIPILFFKTGEDKIDKFLTLSTYKNIFVKKQAPSAAATKPLQPVITSNVTESFDIRKIVWQGAWELALKYPLFGTGVETFAYSYNFVRPAAHNLTSEWDYVYNKAHNEYFNFLATTGFIGLGAYLLMTVFVIGYGIKNYKKSLITLLIISYVTILITNFFGFSTTTIQLFFFLIPAFIILESDATEEAKKDSGQAKIPNSLYNKINPYQWLIIFVLSAAAIYFLISIVVYYLADVDYSYGLKYSKTNDQQKAAEYFEKALKLREEPVYMDKFSSSLAYLSALANMQKQTDLSKQIANMSDSYNRKTIYDYPKNVFYLKTRAKNMYYFYLITNNENELLQAVEALKTARNLYPTDPKIPYTLALYYSTIYDSATNNLRKEEWKKLSLEEIDNTIKLKSNYREAYLFKGQLLKKYGAINEAKKVFEYMLKNFNANDQEVMKELQSL